MNILSDDTIVWKHSVDTVNILSDDTIVWKHSVDTVNILSDDTLVLVNILFNKELWNMNLTIGHG